MRTRVAIWCAALAALHPLRLAAQELEPRAYSASPVGANFAALAYNQSSGSILFNPSVPITDATANVGGVALGYGRTFAIGRYQAIAGIALPYAWGNFTGQVVGRDSSRTLSGPADIRAKLSVNLIGPRASSPADFAKTPPYHAVGGVSLTISAPSGKYESERLINISVHRWGFKPEAGLSYNWSQKWFAEAYAGVWLFTENTSFYPGASKLKQDPLWSVQTHLVRTLARRTWLALDGTWYRGGATQVNGGTPSSRQENARIGGVLALATTRSQSLKAGYSFGSSVRVGQNFGTASLAYQVLWF
ncbi:MAG: transporter [Candidatus Eiseniibacteriota bacterium]